MEKTGNHSLAQKRRNLNVQIMSDAKNVTIRMIREKKLQITENLRIITTETNLAADYCWINREWKKIEYYYEIFVKKPPEKENNLNFEEDQDEGSPAPKRRKIEMADENSEFRDESIDEDRIREEARKKAKQDIRELPKLSKPFQKLIENFGGNQKLEQELQ
ncbi:unnamed protein product [Caenorhabditis angaria]|uniref:Uncharacterized protein n=1 Tax=Caenorhabditis angaria TaxID=860376 RepID=A0A9P1ICH1_9PELO|nr:unnamed protein product [Caenorhabditis angaria]